MNRYKKKVLELEQKLYNLEQDYYTHRSGVKAVCFGCGKPIYGDEEMKVVDHSATYHKDKKDCCHQVNVGE
jgi:hypothetical protein